MKIAVIGAGPAGLTAAYILSKNNCKVDVFEADSRVGGLSSSFTLWGQTVDIGPHRFYSKDKRVNDLLLEVIGDDYTMINRLTRIYYNNTFFSYPIKPVNALVNLGFMEACYCMISYFKEIILPVKQDGSFETWVQSRFGKRLFNIFFKRYSEKLWGMSCKKLDSDFAAQRIKKLSLFEALKNALLGGKGNEHQTLIDKFVYPINGSGAIYNKMADTIIENGSSIYLNKPVKRITTNNKIVTGIEFFDGTTKDYDCVISSMPYTIMVKNLLETPETIKVLAEKLTYRNSIIVYLLVNDKNLFPDNWIYVHSEDLCMGRITNFRNWDKSLYGKEEKTILALEYWCNYNDKLWKSSDDELIALASTEIIKTSFIKQGSIEEGHVLRVNKSYPVYSLGYKKILAPIEEYTSSIKGLSAIGRNGSFKYNNQDHSMLMGLLAAENIINGKSINLCEVNTDYTYQDTITFLKTELSR